MTFGRTPAAFLVYAPAQPRYSPEREKFAAVEEACGGYVEALFEGPHPEGAVKIYFVMPGIFLHALLLLQSFIHTGVPAPGNRHEQTDREIFTRPYYKRCGGSERKPFSVELIFPRGFCEPDVSPFGKIRFMFQISRTAVPFKHKLVVPRVVVDRIEFEIRPPRARPAPCASSATSAALPPLRARFCVRPPLRRRAPPLPRGCRGRRLRTTARRA